MLITARAVSSPMEPVPSWDSIAKGFNTEVLSSLNSRKSLDEVLNSSAGIALSPGPSNLSRLDSM